MSDQLKQLLWQGGEAGPPAMTSDVSLSERVRARAARRRTMRVAIGTGIGLVIVALMITPILRMSRGPKQVLTVREVVAAATGGPDFDELSRVAARPLRAEVSVAELDG